MLIPFYAGEHGGRKGFRIPPKVSKSVSGKDWISVKGYLFSVSKAEVFWVLFYKLEAC